MSQHNKKHPKAGQELVILSSGTKIELDDWFDRTSQSNWEHASDIRSLIYRTRVAVKSLPRDNEVVSCKEGALYHVSEITSIENYPSHYIKGRKQ